MVSESSLHPNEDTLGGYLPNSSFTPIVDKGNLVIKTNSLRKSSDRYPTPVETSNKRKVDDDCPSDKDHSSKKPRYGIALSQKVEPIVADSEVPFTRLCTPESRPNSPVPDRENAHPKRLIARPREIKHRQPLAERSLHNSLPYGESSRSSKITSTDCETPFSADFLNDLTQTLTEPAQSYADDDFDEDIQKLGLDDNPPDENMAGSQRPLLNTPINDSSDTRDYNSPTPLLTLSYSDVLILNAPNIERASRDMNFVIKKRAGDVDARAIFAAWNYDIEREQKIYNLNSMYDSDGTMDMFRREVIKWIKDVCADHRLTRKTFYSSVQYFDYILCNWSRIQPEIIQLLGAVSLILAAKCHDCMMPPLGDLLVFAAQDEYNQIDENVMDGSLDWDLFYPTASDFLARSFQFAALSDGVERKKLPKLLESLLIDNNVDHYTFPSFDPEAFARVAAIMDEAILLRESKRRDALSLLPRTTGYNIDQIMECYKLIENIEEHEITNHVLSTMSVTLDQCKENGEPFDLREHQIMVYQN